jgi:hypothetical protein
MYVTSQQKPEDNFRRQNEIIFEFVDSNVGYGSKDREERAKCKTPRPVITRPVTRDLSCPTLLGFLSPHRYCYWWQFSVPLNIRRLSLLRLQDRS